MLPLRLRGARTHNLRNLDLDLTPGELVALTGPSGAGKSSLALDTLYAEGQRRFVESFSPYARQFLERLPRPPVDSLNPVAAGVAVDRRVQIKSSRSTLATLADLEAYLSALFAKEAVPRCADCGVDAVLVRAETAAEWLGFGTVSTPPPAHVQASLGESSLRGERVLLTASLTVASLDELLTRREGLLRDGHRRVWLQGEVRDLDGVRPSDVLVDGSGTLEVVIDRLRVEPATRARFVLALESAWALGASATARFDDRALGLVPGLVCPRCARGFEAPRPGLFSYNSPLGACETCKGFGRTIAVDWSKVFPDGDKSLKQGAIRPWNGKSSQYERRTLAEFAAAEGIPFDAPWNSLTPAQRERVLDGEGAVAWEQGGYPGVRAWFKYLESKTYKMHVRVLLARYREYAPCTACGGGRLNAKARSYRVAGKNLMEWHALDVTQAETAVQAVTTHDPQGEHVRQELLRRLQTLQQVGLGYLGLDRQARTLSGGEVQRAALTTALATELTSALFVLDEPTVGLHPSDVPPLAAAVERLARAGNTVVVIDHEREILERADRVLALGPGAGPHGGALSEGTRKAAPAAARAAAPRAARGQLELREVSLHNLRIDALRIPLGCLVALAGPSGSGKSSLLDEVLYPLLARASGDRSVPAPPAAAGRVESSLPFTSVVLVDQAPLGRTARGNAATYTKAWNRLRERFAAEPAALRAGLASSHFSFNVAGKGSGRCEACQGEGYETVEMQFLADVQFPCPICKGQRFRPEVLAIRHQGRSVAEVLGMSVGEVRAHFSPGEERDYVLERALDPLIDLGLDYLPLGQPLSTLSGGEAQRLKLARGLASADPHSLFLIDEPSAGLAPDDTAKVVAALHSLTERGASVLLVEHDLAVLRSVDHVVELGPGAGAAGGTVVFAGPPSALHDAPTKTGEALRHQPKRRGSARRTAMAQPDAIVVVGAQEHNLKNVDCSIPHGAMTVVTGPSGSGKSSLAFDVIYAEGQRRFLETLTPYARQFLPTLPRPRLQSITHVPPSIALEQRESRAGTASTVATITEIAHFLRLLYAKLAEPACELCGGRVRSSSEAEVRAAIARHGEQPVTLYARAVSRRKGTYLDVFNAASRRGIGVARVDGNMVATDPPPKLSKTHEHTIDLVVHYGPADRIADAVVVRALDLGHGSLRLGVGAARKHDDDEHVLSLVRACERCGHGMPALEPGQFSFSTPEGRCARCEGSGQEKSGKPCKHCGGDRLGAVGRSARLFDETLPAFSRRSLDSALERASGFEFSGEAALVAQAPLKELRDRLAFACRVGLGYLSLDRAAASLSGGELQRLALAAQLGSGLTGALYVLDEPTIGLHPRDTARLLGSLAELVKTGSTVLVVEHDPDTIAAADHVIDMGPEGGSGGGHVVHAGVAKEVLGGQGPTARALAESHLALRPTRAMQGVEYLELLGARAHNLDGVDLRIPKGRLTVVAGVSGSGKSTLVRRILLPAVRRSLGLETDKPLPFAKLKKLDGIERCIAVDQSPIGRTPRSVPATFVGVWDEIRKLYAALPESQVRGFSATRFSFNAAKGGRCPECDGQGHVVSEMSFLPDVVNECGTCQGLRFDPATLEVTYRGVSAGALLKKTVREAKEIFAAHPKIANAFSILDEIGVGYLQIGQPSNTLSGGEAQRLKLAAELSSALRPKPTLYVLDEPTTGLHLSDVRRLVGVFDRLLERGDTLVVIEHHMDVVRSADWVVELGPEGGSGGGRVVFEGTAEALRSADTPTGRALA